MSITRILTITLLFSSLLLIVSGRSLDTEEGYETQAQEYVDAHNRIRDGKGVPPLTWDNELYKASKAYAEERSNDCKMEHSTNLFGENLFWGGGDDWNPTTVVNIWAEEANFYDENANTCTPGEMCGHYTQIIWRDTQRVGCAKTKCSGEGLYFVCSYDPPGNYEGEHPLVGKAPNT